MFASRSLLQLCNQCGSKRVVNHGKILLLCHICLNNLTQLNLLNGSQKIFLFTFCSDKQQQCQQNTGSRCQPVFTTWNLHLVFLHVMKNERRGGSCCSQEFDKTQGTGVDYHCVPSAGQSLIVPLRRKLPPTDSGSVIITLLTPCYTAKIDI